MLLGSTAKMGAGTNVQDRLIALHDLDCPWRPSDLQQRLGRIVRQGKENEEVEIYRYVTEGTFDAYLYQLVENKQHPHLPGAHFGKQFLLFGFAVRRVDKGDFLLRDSGVHQFLF